MTFESDDSDDREEPVVPPLPPEDRIWRHPSEMNAPPRGTDSGHGAAPIIPSRSGHGRVALAVASAMTGAALMIGLLFATGLVDRDPRPPAVVELVAEPSDDHDVIGATALPAVVRIESDQPEGRLVGAGVVLRSDGHVLTTASLARSADTVTVVLHDGSELEGVVVGHDPLTDVGVIRIEATQVDPILLGSARDLETGERIMAVSAPDAGPPTRLTDGVVTALGLTVEGADAQPLHAMIETSDALNGLDPGTAIVDQQGALVAIISTDEDEPRADGGTTEESEEGAGPVATPVETARIVAADIIDTGEARHPWLGVSVRAADDGGALIATVAPAGPAAEAGLEAGDRVTSVGGTDIDDVADLVIELRLRHPGDTIKITYERSGLARSCEPLLEEWQLEGTS